MTDRKSKSKFKFENFITPRGVSIFPSLVTPDTKYKKEGEFHVKMRFDPEGPVLNKNGKPTGQTIAEMLDARWDNPELLEAAQEAHDEAKAKAKTKRAKDALAQYLERATVPYDEELDDEGEPTGFIIVSFKSNASYVDKKTEKTIKRVIKFFNAKGKPTKPESLWGGSELKINFMPSPYASPMGYGVKYLISAVQIIELVEAGGDGAGYGFGEEDGGYDDEGSHGMPADDDDDDVATEDGAESGDTDDDPDF